MTYFWQIKWAVLSLLRSNKERKLLQNYKKRLKKGETMELSELDFRIYDKNKKGYLIKPYTVKCYGERDGEKFEIRDYQNNKLETHNLLLEKFTGLGIGEGLGEYIPIYEGDIILLPERKYVKKQLVFVKNNCLFDCASSEFVTIVDNVEHICCTCKIKLVGNVNINSELLTSSKAGRIFAK